MVNGEFLPDKLNESQRPSCVKSSETFIHVTSTKSPFSLKKEMVFLFSFFLQHYLDSIPFKNSIQEAIQKSPSHSNMEEEWNLFSVCLYKALQWLFTFTLNAW